MREEASDGKASKAKLSQAVHQRWVSLHRMLHGVLSNWEMLEMFYLKERKTTFPLDGRKDEVWWECRFVEWDRCRIGLALEVIGNHVGGERHWLVFMYRLMRVTIVDNMKNISLLSCLKTSLRLPIEARLSYTILQIINQRGVLTKVRNILLPEYPASAAILFVR